MVLEAEEVREDLADFEDFSFSGSLLYSDETIIDSSGGLPITLNKKVRVINVGKLDDLTTKLQDEKKLEHKDQKIFLHLLSRLVRPATYQ